MSDNKCKWPSKYDTHYKCLEDPLPNDPDGYCILHSGDEKKDLEAFKQKVEERIRAPDKIDLRGCYFPKDFPAEYFQVHTFNKPVVFSEATFSQEVRFSGATFSQNADFSGTKFSRAEFLRTAFLQEARFSGATFSQVAYFIEAEFLKKAYFQGVKFLKETYFLGVKFSQANFSYAEFKERAHFLPFIDPVKDEITKVTFGPSEFHRTRFSGEVVFEDIDLSQCFFLNSNIDKVDFRYCEFGEEKGRKNVLKDERYCDEKVAGHERTGSSPVPTEKKTREGYEPVHRLYLELKKNFEEKRDWNTAGDFHFGEMESRRKMKEGWLRRNIFSLEALYYWASGYGERPWRAGFWLGTLILSFTLFYLPPTGKVSPSPKVLSEAGQALLGTDPQGTSATTTKEAFQAQPPKKRDIQSPGEATSKFERYQVWFKRYLEGLNASLRVTARLDTKETGWPRTIQSILGPLFIALFALALRRKVKR